MTRSIGRNRQGSGAIGHEWRARLLGFNGLSNVLGASPIEDRGVLLTFQIGVSRSSGLEFRTRPGAHGTSLALQRNFAQLVPSRLMALDRRTGYAARLVRHVRLPHPQIKLASLADDELVAGVDPVAGSAAQVVHVGKTGLFGD